MTVAVVLAATLARSSAASDVLQVRKAYQGLQSFSMRAKGSAGSGLYGCDAHLTWRSGNVFTLKLFQPGVIKPVRAYSCDGKTVTKLAERDSQKSDSPLFYSLSKVPQWEGEGGLILSWLVGSPIARHLENEIKNGALRVDYGPTKTWRDEKVIEVSLTQAGAKKSLLNLLLSADKRPLVGTTKGPEWIHYYGQRPVSSRL